MSEQAEKDRMWYVKELKGEECLCGRPKQSRKSFCYRCYRALPHEMQQDLYCMVGFGYEEAFEAAATWLETEVW